VQRNSRSHLSTDESERTQIHDTRGGRHSLSLRAGDPNAKLNKVKVTFLTHHDNKDHDTQLDVTVKNKQCPFLSQDLAEGRDLAHEVECKDNPPSSHAFDLDRKANNLTLKDMILPTYNIHIQPNGRDRWILDVTIALEFSDGSSFSSEKKGIVLDQDNRDYSGVFEG
jgi:hypothetical protein